MPKATFLKDFDWDVPGARTKTVRAYKKDSTVTVTTECLNAARAIGAVAKGKVPVETDGKTEQNDSNSGE